MDFAGKLTGLRTPPAKSNLQIIPYTVFSNLNTGGSDAIHKNEAKAGGELKWAITPNSVLDLSFNTDFAQADADLQVNNVSRFSVFFPEKRQFFLENASLFGTGLQGEDLFGTGGPMYLQPFFSRRIGLDVQGKPVPIDAGARFINRTSKRSYGAMYVRQHGQGDMSSENIFVGRYTQNTGKANRIGAIVTLKNTEASPMIKVHNNAVAAIDGFFRFGDAHSLSLMISESFNNNEKPTGVAAYAQWLYTTNTVTGWLTQSFVGQGYNPELGFVSRRDIIGTTPGLLLNIRQDWLPFRKIIRSFNPGITAQLFHQSSTGVLQESIYTVYPAGLEFQKGGNMYFSINRYCEFLQDVFSPLGIDIPPGLYKFSRYLYSMASDASKKISYSIKYEAGKYYDGNLQTSMASLNLSPAPEIFSSFTFTNNRFKNVGPAGTSQNILLFSVESRLALNPRVQLSGLYQRNTQNDRQAYNIRFAWEFKPLSNIYLMYNNQSFESLRRQQEQNMILKFSYLKQF
jgi:hypothetical protein